MKILVAGWDSGWGVEAVQTVVSRAVQRGHQVRVLGTEGLRDRFELAGAGFRKNASAATLRKAIGRVLDDGRYRAAAGRMAAQLARERDEGLVVDEIERAAARSPAGCIWDGVARSA